MKPQTLLILLSLIVLTLRAETESAPPGNKKHHSFSSAAEKYDHQADKLEARAASEKDPAIKAKLQELAGKNRRLAHNKREATHAQQKGESYDWSAYHSTQSEATKLREEIRKEKGMSGKKVSKEKWKSSKADMVQKDKSGKKQTYVKEKDPQAKEPKSKSKYIQTDNGFKVRTSLQ